MTDSADEDRDEDDDILMQWAVDCEGCYIALYCNECGPRGPEHMICAYCDYVLCANCAKTHHCTTQEPKWKKHYPRSDNEC
jgi:hypothetical protein